MSHTPITKITKRDVFFYLADELDRERRIEIELASKTDQDVQGWFDELEPAGIVDQLPPSSDSEPMEEFDWEANRDALISALADVNQDNPYLGLLDVASEPTGTTDDVSILPGKELELFADGSMAISIPTTLAAAGGARQMQSIEIPCIRVDEATRTLTIRQKSDAISSGEVQVVAKRKSNDGRIETLQPVTITLERRNHPTHGEYWNGTIKLKELLGQFEALDEFSYVVIPVSKES